jgi:exosortase/archaeosortase family protein
MKKQNSPVKFALLFVSLFLAFYYFNILFFGVTSPGNHYSPFLADHLNYIYALRWLLLHSSAAILRFFGFTAIVNNYELLVAGRGIIQLVYSCLGLGVMSFFTAFVLAYPKLLRPKLIFLLAGIIVIQLLNITRFVLLVLFWHRSSRVIIDHHTIFNILIYIIISISLYFWVKTGITVNKQHAKN